MKLHHLKELEDHIASANCSHPPHLKDFTFDQNPVPGTTPLLLACQHGELDSVKHIVESWGVDVRASAKYYSYPYYRSSRSIRTPIATPLFVAASHGNDNIVRYLLEKGAHVSAKISLKSDKNDGLTPLYEAVNHFYSPSSESLLEQQEERSSVVRSLLEFGADPIADTFRPSDGQPMWMEKMCGIGATTALINHGLDLKRRNPSTGETLLHHWVGFPVYSWANRLRCFTEEDSSSIVKLLVEKGADLLARDDNGLTPLLRAANHFNLKVLDYLIEREEYDQTEKMIAMELAGAAILFDSGNALLFPKAFEYWRRAHQLRQKQIEVSGSSAEKNLSRKIGNIVEWTTLADLDQLEQHPEDYRIQAFLVKLRILSGFLGRNHHHLSTRYITYLSESTSLNEEEKLIQILGIRWEMLEAATRRFDPLSSNRFFRIEIGKDVDNLVSTLSTLKEKFPALLSFERIKTSLDRILQVTDSSPFTISNRRRSIDESHPRSKRIQFTRSLITLLEMFFQLPKILNERETTSLTQSLRLLGPSRLGYLLLQTCLKLGNFKDLALVRLLLEAGADPNVDVTFAGNSSLHVVAGMGDRKLGDAACLLLVEFGAKLHQVNKAGKTALDVWIELNETEDNWNEEAGGWSARPEWCCPLPTLLRLAARVIRVNKIPYADGKTPTVLHSLIELRSNNNS